MQFGTSDAAGWSIIRLEHLGLAFADNFKYQSTCKS